MEYTIQNERFTARVSAQGAEVCGVKDIDGRELIWQADPAVWARHAPVCFPWCGKVQDGWFEWKGARHSAPTQHGFMRDVEHELVTQGPDSVAFRYVWPGEAGGWLWPFTFETRHTLAGDVLSTVCTAENTGTEAMPVQMGFHPGFVCPFVEGSKIEDYEVRFESGLVVPMEPHLFDNDSIAYQNIGAWARLTHPGSGKYIEVATAAFDRTLLWSKPGIPGYVCVEPWCGYPGPQHDLLERPGAALLAPGEKRSWEQRLTFHI